MLIQLTTAGAMLLQNATGPITLTSFELGSDYNYTPEPTDTMLHGTEVYAGTPSLPLAVNANIVKWSCFIDYPVGPFQFGEIGLYVGTTLFALGTSSELIEKLALTSVDPGNSIVIDVYVSVVGTNYNIWLNLNQSSNSFRMGVLQTADQLPPSAGAVPNAYIVQGASSYQSAFFAYTDTNGLWNFDAYDFAQQTTATITAVDSQSVTIAMSQYVMGMSPAYFGEVLLQFSTGALYGIVRYVETAVISGDTVTLGFATPLAMLPAVGDEFLVFGRQILSTQVMNLPPATTTKLGAIMVGYGLLVDSTGLLSVDETKAPVQMVNGQMGDVMLTASDIYDIAKVAITGNYYDLLNYPAPYTLMPATTTTLGGVKAPATSEMHLTIATDGTIDLAFNPVKSVNMQYPDPSTGDVEVYIPTYTGLVNPVALSANTDLNTMMTTGLYYITSSTVGTILNLPLGVATEATLEVVPLTMVGPGDVIQRVSTSSTMYFRGLTGNTWSLWNEVATTMTHMEQSITATMMNQTTFLTTGYTPGYIEVFIAGLRLVPNVDYTATDSLNITLINAALIAQVQIGAVLTISSFTIFSISNAVPKSMLASSTGATLVGYNSMDLGLTTVGYFLSQLEAGFLAGKFTTLNVSNNTPSTSTTTGAVTVVGGLGVEGELNVGSLSSVNLNFTQASMLPVPTTGTVFRLVNADGVETKIDVDAYVSTGNPMAGVSLRGARGTAAAPMAIQNTDIIGLVAGHGYGTTMFQMGSTAVMQFVAEENFTDTSMATAIAWQVTPTGSIVRTEKMRLNSMGVLMLEANLPSTSVLTGSGVVTGGLGVSGAVNAGMTSSVSANVTPIGSQMPAPVGTMLRATEADDTNTKMVLDSYNTMNPTSGYIGRGARGTAAIPTAVQSTDVIAAFGGIGFGTTEYQPLVTGSVHIVAEGAFTDTSNPTAVAFMVTPSGSVTKTEAGRFNSMGVLMLEANVPSTSMTTGSEVITGGLGVSGAIYAGSFNGPVMATTLTATDITTFGMQSSITAMPVSAIAETMVPSTATTSATYYKTMGATAASTFTLPTLYHYSATQGTFGTGSTVTSQYGYYADATLIGAVHNMGFVGNLPSVPGNWNLYMMGTAANYAAGIMQLGNAVPMITAEQLQVTGSARATMYSAAQMGFRASEVTNGKQGVVTLVAGTITVSNTSVTANSRIFLTGQMDGGTPGWVRVSGRTIGSSFTITSSSATDTSMIAYEIFEPA